MRAYDFAPLYRSTVGFDRLANLVDRALTADVSANSYPPYNIERSDENSYRITIAVAGFSESELSVELREHQLFVTGKKAESDETADYLHRGIATRAFEKRFQLADHVHATAASVQDGLLHIDLVRELPDALKPRAIEIQSGNTLDVKAKKLSKAKTLNA